MRALPATIGCVLLTVGPGCDPCASGAEPTFEDSDGALGADGLAELEAAYADFVAAIGPDRVCIARVEVVERAGSDGALIHGGPDWVVEIDPASTTPAVDLRLNLCLALDLREDLTSRAPELFERLSFATVCGLGPPDTDYLDEVVAACGASPLDARDTFMSEEVYRFAPEDRGDGPLAASLGAAVRLDGRTVMDVAPFGAGLLALSYPGTDPREVRAYAVDLATGTTTDVATALYEDVSWSVYGGPGGAVIVDRADEGPSAVHVVDVDTHALTTVSADLTYGHGEGVVSDGVLYRAPDSTWPGPMQAVDLATGAVTVIAMPAPPESMEALANGIVPAPGGFVLSYLEATVQRSGDFTSIGVWDHVMVRWSAADGAWTEITRGLWFMEAGVTSDGRILGTLLGADAVFGAYAYADDRLTVSDDLCLEETGRPYVVADDRAWTFAEDGDSVVITPFEID